MEPNEKSRKPADGEKEKDSGRFSSNLFDWGESLVIAVLFVVVLFTFVFRIVIVDGHSMESTLHHGDLMIVSSIGYHREHGDIVVLRSEYYDRPIVKRIIAVEGDTVDIDFQNAQVYLNGEPLDEPYLDDFYYFEEEGVEFPQTVPEGCIFVLGDNRTGSTDSRNPNIGMVDERAVIGKVRFTVFPFDAFGAVE